MKEIKSRLAESNPERCAIFEAKAPAFVKNVLANIKDYEFYVGESMNPEGAVGLLNYREDGNRALITYFLLLFRNDPILNLLQGWSQDWKIVSEICLSWSLHS